MKLLEKGHQASDEVNRSQNLVWVISQLRYKYNYTRMHRYDVVYSEQPSSYLCD